MAVATEPMAVAATYATVLCCSCGSPIQPNPTGMCPQCISTEIDVTEGIARSLTVHQCRGCKRYLGPPWVAADLESRQLMALCLKKVTGLKGVKLVDAAWVWTEPHSRRLKLRLTVQKEVVNGAVVQQAFVVEFTVRNQQCDACQASFTNSTWKAVVQVRQRVDHKRTFFHLEQLILKHNAHANCSKVESARDGMDFFFTERNQAGRFVDFLEGVVPCRVKHSKKLISADNHSNIGIYSFTHLVTVAPVCKNDLVLLPAKLAAALGSMPRLALVSRVTDSIHLVDPRTAQTAELTADRYWRYEFAALLSSARLAPFVALGSEPLPDARLPAAPARKRQRKARLASVVLARESDLGSNDRQSSAVSHLGHLIRAGDTLLCYDLAAANLPEEAVDAMNALKLRPAGSAGGGGVPDVVVVQKSYARNGAGDGGGSSGGGFARQWQLRELEKEQADEAAMGKRDAAAAESDYERFLQQLEADREMRAGINIYKKQQMPQQQHAAAAGETAAAAAAGGSSSAGAAAAAATEEFGEGDGDASDVDEEQLRMEELLDDLTLDDSEAAPDDAVAVAAAAGAPEVFAAGTAPEPAGDLRLSLGELDPDL